VIGGDGIDLLPLKAAALFTAQHGWKGRPPCREGILGGTERSPELRRRAAHRLLPPAAAPWPGSEGWTVISSTPNRKFKSVAILPLWPRQHTSLKNLEVPVASIDSKPSPNSIYGANLACVLYRSRSDK
jgi:hypothetical protein